MPNQPELHSQPDIRCLHACKIKADVKLQPCQNTVHADLQSIHAELDTMMMPTGPRVCLPVRQDKQQKAIVASCLEALHNKWGTPEVKVVPSRRPTRQRGAQQVAVAAAQLASVLKAVSSPQLKEAPLLPAHRKKAKAKHSDNRQQAKTAVATAQLAFVLDSPEAKAVAAAQLVSALDSIASPPAKAVPQAKVAPAFCRAHGRVVQRVVQQKAGGDASFESEVNIGAPPEFGVVLQPRIPVRQPGAQPAQKMSELLPKKLDAELLEWVNSQKCAVRRRGATYSRGVSPADRKKVQKLNVEKLQVQIPVDTVPAALASPAA